MPLHKGDQDDPGNYRGITLLSTLDKLFTKVLNNRLNSWAEIYNVYIEAQAGFRKNMSWISKHISLSSPHTSTLDNLSGAAFKAIFKLKSYLIKFPDLKTSYNLVVPVLSYGGEIWAYTNVDVLERICTSIGYEITITN